MTYKFCENRVIRIKTSHFFLYHFANEWLELDRFNICIKGDNLKGYAWDGCTPKFAGFDLYFGTPDGIITKAIDKFIEIRGIDLGGKNYKWNFIKEYREKTYFASLVHDILYQFKADIKIPRKTADLIFLELLQRRDFKLAKLYYYAVRIFGGFFGKWK